MTATTGSTPLDGTIRPEDPVTRIMRAPVGTVDEGGSLRDAAAELAADGIGALLVPGRHDVAGILSERDVVAAVAAGADLEDTQVRDLMTVDTVTLSPTDPIRIAGEAMLEVGVRHLPVLRDGNPVGIVSVRDVLAVLLA